MALSQEELAQLAAQWGQPSAPPPSGPVLNAGTFEISSPMPAGGMGANVNPGVPQAPSGPALRTSLEPPPRDGLKMVPPELMARIDPQAHAPNQGAVDMSHTVKSESDSIPYTGGGGGGGAPAPMGGGGAMVIPGGWQPHSRATTVQEGTQFSPETIKDLNSAEEHERKAAALQADAAQKQNAQDQRLMHLQANVMQAEQASEAVRQGIQQHALAKQQADLSNAIDDVRQQKVDPNHWWSSKSLGGKLSLGIGMALRDFGAALAHRPSDTLEFLKAQQDADIRSQMENIEQGNRNVAHQQGLYNQMRQRFQDQDQAAAAARLAAREQLGMQIKAAAAGSQDPVIKANAEKALANIDHEAAQLRAKFDEAAQRKVAVSSQETYRPDQVVGFGGGGGGAAPGDVFKGSDELYYQDGSGQGYLGRSKEEVGKIRDTQATAAQIKANLEKLRDLDAKAGTLTKLWGLDAYNRERKRLIADTNTSLTVFRGQGAMSKGDQENSENAMAAAQGLGKFANNTKLYDNAIKSVQNTVDERMKSQHATPVREVVGKKSPKAGGGLERQYVPVEPSAGGVPYPFKPAGGG